MHDEPKLSLKAVERSSLGFCKRCLVWYEPKLNVNIYERAMQNQKDSHNGEREPLVNPRESFDILILHKRELQCIH